MSTLTKATLDEPDTVSPSTQGKEDIMIPEEFGRKRSRLIGVICEEWFKAQEYPGTLDSEVVYERLVEEGEHFAEGEIDSLLTHLREKEQVIHAPMLFDRDLSAKHSAMTITGIAHWLC